MSQGYADYVRKAITPYLNARSGALIGGSPMLLSAATPAATVLGGLIGAGMGGKGNRMSGAVHGAARGFGTALGTGLGGGLIGAPVGGVLGYAGAPVAGGLTGAAAGGGLGGYGGYHAGAGLAGLLTDSKAPWAKKDENADEDNDKKTTRKAAMHKYAKVYEASERVENMPIKETSMNHKKCTPGEFGMRVKESAVRSRAVVRPGQSARAFGEKVANKLDWGGLAQAGLGGAALGAGVGGLAGLLAPGEDSRGRQRSRVGAMLRGALGGGLMGGMGGAAVEAYRPGSANDVMKYMQSFWAKQPQRPQAPTYTPNMYPATYSDYATLDADQNSALDIPASTRVPMPQGSVPNPTAEEIPDLDAAGL